MLFICIFKAENHFVMNAKKRKVPIEKAEEAIVSNTISQTKSESEKLCSFDFDAEFEEGYTPDQFKQEIFKRIKAYPWKK
jgi:Zn-dependent M28 family amino/carboxypeptidase